MKLTDKQRKYIWIGVAVLAFIRFVPPYLTMITRQIQSSGHTEVHGKPSPAVPMPAPAVSPAAATVSPFAVAQPDLFGIWNGSQILPSMDSCHIQLELRASDQKPGDYAGYLTRSCGPLGALISNSEHANRAAIFERMTPTSAIMSGPMLNGSIELHLERSIGIPADHCEFTDYTLSPFGQQQLQAQWKQGTCPAGNIVLTKMRG